MPKWTEQQSEAIFTKGQDTLVAAAAGSGKTAVLVERIIQKVISTKDAVNIDELLVATFTNAAAQEMRNRVAQALESALEDNPDSNHLKRQLTLLQQAQISTLHSFCLDLVKRYAYLLDIDPGFRIADDIESDLLRQEVMEDLFEEWYGEDFQDREAFFELVERFSSDRSDQQIESLILKLYDFARQNPWPESWLDQVADTYQISADDNEDDFEWLKLLKRDVKDQLDRSETLLHQALDLTREPDGPYKYADALDSDLSFIQRLKGASSDWEALRKEFEQLKFVTLSGRGMECDPVKQERVKTLRDKVKKIIQGLKDELFARSLNDQFEDMNQLYPTIHQLVSCVKQFKQSYQELKKEKGLVDFSDLEHFALTILIDHTKTGLAPSEVALSLRNQYKEVLVDEYQDTNMVQESILQLVSDEEPGNLFMVGDVKQSIYRFRHAEPSLFIQKYKDYQKEGNSGKRIDLAKNFRSRKEILRATNYVFRQVMDEKIGEIAYDEDAELIYGNDNYDNANQDDVETELVILDRSDYKTEESESDGETALDLTKAELEGRTYAKRIKEWVGSNETPPRLVFDKDSGVSRPAAYRDIVILMRSLTWAPTIMEELKKEGIPVYAELSTGYLEAIEIKVMMSLLKVIDNAKQDIPLASVLKSPIVGINEEELAQIRLQDPKNSYYEALTQFVQEQEEGKLKNQLTRFLTQLTQWRTEARQGSLSELIWKIYRETGYYDFVAGMPGGRQRQANLRALYDRARSYEETSFRGLFRFLRMIERMEERGDDLGAARALGEQEDVVRITTIHKSKGLEYPIVILGALGKQFNQQDLKDRYLLHKDLGFGSKWIDIENRLMYPTLLYHAVKSYMKQELWAEEMRVLYVAMTRAKEKLVMIGTLNSFEKTKEKWQDILNQQTWTLPDAHRLEMDTYLDWIAMSLIRHQSGSLLRNDEFEQQISTEIADDLSSWIVKTDQVKSRSSLSKDKSEDTVDLKQVIQNRQPVKVTKPGLDQFVDERLSYEYPYQDATRYRAKQTVTEIKRQNETIDDYAATDIQKPYKRSIIQRPQFMQEKKTLSPQEFGTAMHTYMQHLNFNRSWDKLQLEHFAETLVERELLEASQAIALDFDSIEAFLTSDLMTILSSADVIEREVPFSLMLNADTVYKDWQSNENDQLFVQGIIDLLVKTEEGWVIIDYKTDKIHQSVDENERQRLRGRYQTQIDLYSKAIEKILGHEIKKRYLYFFDQAFVLKL
ncbi:DNA helicase/exodeoxyribonuclease V, subunit A [Pelagirhabdus alkalitolerans]|uniref:ATP-dependent helicase/nuclease subunit A n=1 Tax=Pelagirhabdus alkalitolerans TaxID=1612202 RepID=A0A1G6LN13_9BACI|nr:helicase-exonuclease AddAB subunit AddA [Pelagirhabdus alkalitolerans]SDC44682.1 DNA helicase/exodeoxyribonuclease V, subunit A [Pelagirhabdus alkalitolerans]